MTREDKIQVLAAATVAIATVIGLGAAGGPASGLAVAGGLAELAGVALLYDALRDRPRLPPHPFRWLRCLLLGRTSPVGKSVELRWFSRTATTPDETPAQSIARLDRDIGALLEAIGRESQTSRVVTERLIEARTRQPAIGVALLIAGIVLSALSNVV